MSRGNELALPVAGFVVALAAVTGGAFDPPERLAVGCLLSLAWLMAAVGWRRRLQKYELLALSLLAWGAVSAIWVGAAPLVSKETLTGWLIAWALWSLARSGDARSLEITLRIVVAAAAVIAVSILAAALQTGTIRVGGVFDNPNLAAALLVAAAPVGLVVGERGWFRVAWLALTGSALLLTGSRAGLLAALVAAGVSLPRGRARLAGMVAGGAVGLMAVVWRFASQPDLLAWHRLSIWRAVLAIWSSRPWTGVGPGCLVEAAGAERILHQGQVGQYQFVISFAESTPLAVLVQLGMVGLALSLAAALSWWVSVRRSGAAGSTALRAALTGMVTFGLFHDVLTLDVVLWWWVLVLGGLEALASDRWEVGESRSGWVARAAAGLVLIWLTMWGVVAPAMARRQAHRARPVTADVERIRRIEPWYDEPAAARVGLMLSEPEAWSWSAAAEALSWASGCARVHSGLARRWADLAKVHLRVLTDLGGTEHDVEAARRAFDRACELDPHLPWHWLERARLERVLDRNEAAVAYCRRALAEEPNTVRGWLMLARLELELGRVEAARAALSEAQTRAMLVERPGLTDYERELLQAPPALIRDLERALVEIDPGRS